MSRGRKEGLVDALALRPMGEDAGGDRLWIDEGLDHAGTAAAAYADARIYDWLLDRTLPGPQ